LFGGFETVERRKWHGLRASIRGSFEVVQGKKVAPIRGGEWKLQTTMCRGFETVEGKDSGTDSGRRMDSELGTRMDDLPEILALHPSSLIGPRIT
jgi:hypothetical protein